MVVSTYINFKISMPSNSQYKRKPTNFNHDSLKAEFCSGEDVWAFLLAGFLKTTKVMECFRKMKTAIYFLARLLGSPRYRY